MELCTIQFRCYKRMGHWFQLMGTLPVWRFSRILSCSFRTRVATVVTDQVILLRSVVSGYGIISFSSVPYSEDTSIQEVEDVDNHNADQSSS